MTNLASICRNFSGVPEAYKFCRHFPNALPTSADLKSQLLWETMAKTGYSIQELVAKVNDTVANG